jgi:hypothetical protein
MPLISLTTPTGNSALRPVLVNSVPKSGTYFLEAALIRLGAMPLRLHLGEHQLHDNRGAQETEIHWQPAQREVPAPAPAVAHLLRPGDVVVGHLADAAALDEVMRAGVVTLHDIRDLRAVLVSLYYFKRDRVAPRSAADAIWRSLPSESGFIAFLNQFEDKDILHIRRVAETILTRTEPVLRYENMVMGITPPGVEDVLPGLGVALREACGQPTSTLSAKNEKVSPWTAAAEAFFQESGLSDLNHQLGFNG